MLRSVRLSTLVGALLGAFAVAAFAGDPEALSAGLAAWASRLPLGITLALVAGGAVGGAILTQSAVPKRRRTSKGGPAWPYVAGVLALVAVLYGKAFGEPLRAAMTKVVALVIGDGSA